VLFSSSLFVFLFLPIVLLGHAVLRGAWRNAWLLLASLVFYGSGEPAFVFVMLGSIAISWILGIRAARERTTGGALAVPLACALHLGLLVLFKYADWLVASVSTALVAIGAIDAALPSIGSWIAYDSVARDLLLTNDGSIRLPIGISFFTFQALSYVIDVRRGAVPAQRSYGKLALYIALFPQLIAGPIVRYGQVANEIDARDPRREDLARGIERFVLGLAKKVLIADVLATPCDAIFALDPASRTCLVAWFGITCYALEIYFDFSGYSDMAIGIGRMLGFRFKENFLHPYVAFSVTEFWRRWHVSLSTWFRDYLYIPLGGNRRGAARTALNLGIVFLLCGLWHGAAATFIAWGLWHGAFLALERTRFGAAIARAPRIFRHGYALLVVLIGWVLFRAESLPAAGDYLLALCGLGPSTSPFRLEHFGDPWVATVFSAGLLGATPWLGAWLERVAAWRDQGATAPWLVARCCGLLALAALFTLTAMHLAAGSFHPFIYFRF
jgi:alginate O-acetyltransferase complex protein AlgI